VVVKGGVVAVDCILCGLFSINRTTKPQLMSPVCVVWCILSPSTDDLLATPSCERQSVH
jgi:hypothetical protein